MIYDAILKLVDQISHDLGALQNLKHDAALYNSAITLLRDAAVIVFSPVICLFVFPEGQEDRKN